MTGSAQSAIRAPDRKEAIAQASAELFAERGFAAVGIDDIGAAVGITGPAIYRHFAGKEALLGAVILGLLEEFVRRAEDVSATVEEGTGSADPLADLVAGSVDIALDSPAQVATYIRERGRLSGEMARQAAVHARQLRGIWESILRQEFPTLPSELVAVRQEAVLGVTGAMTLLRTGVVRPRLDELLIEASLRMLRMPAAAPTTGTPQHVEPSWQPQISRREAILNAALTLMRVKGYAGVGIDEIGEAAGISGPAVYRHYASKSDILLDAYDRVGSRVAVGVESALDGATGPTDALRRLIDSYVTIAFDNVDLIIATGQEGAALPKAERPRLVRQRRDIAESWIRVVLELRSDLTEPEVRMHVASVFPMVNHVAQLPAREIDRVPEVKALVGELLVGAPA
ncbi:MAG TPA: TetR/AcrR family transcriptional regulator [Acidimicrobiales bacterium]|jgi:AcrR family transcriptional regulator|nr:TetR/AcrR family transcriptional regulator [Acidimicrobiales bacterium]